MKNFSIRFSMRCTEDQWRNAKIGKTPLYKALEDLGYNLRGLVFASNYPYVATYYKAKADQIGTTQTPFKDGRSLVDEWNAELFYALCSQKENDYITVGEYMTEEKTGKVYRCDSFHGEQWLESDLPVELHRGSQKNVALKRENARKSTYDDLLAAFSGKSALVSFRPKNNVVAQKMVEMNLDGKEKISKLVEAAGEAVTVFDWGKIENSEPSSATELISDRGEVNKVLEEFIEERKPVTELLNQAITERLVETGVLKEGETLKVDYPNKFEVELPETKGANADQMNDIITETDRIVSMTLQGSEKIEKANDKITTHLKNVDDWLDEISTGETPAAKTPRGSMTFKEILEAFGDNRTVVVGELRPTEIVCSVPLEIGFVSRDTVGLGSDYSDVEHQFIFSDVSTFMMYAAHQSSTGAWPVKGL